MLYSYEKYWGSSGQKFVIYWQIHIYITDLCVSLNLLFHIFNSSIKIRLNFDLYFSTCTQIFFHLKFPTKRIIIKHFFDCVAKQQLTCIIGVRSGKHLRGCKSIRMWPKKRFGLLYMAWMSDNKFNIGPGHTIDSNHGLCWSSLRLACK